MPWVATLAALVASFSVTTKFLLKGNRSILIISVICATFVVTIDGDGIVGISSNSWLHWSFLHEKESCMADSVGCGACAAIATRRTAWQWIVVALN